MLGFVGVAFRTIVLDDFMEALDVDARFGWFRSTGLTPVSSCAVWQALHPRWRQCFGFSAFDLCSFCWLIVSVKLALA